MHADYFKDVPGLQEKSQMEGCLKQINKAMMAMAQAAAVAPEGLKKELVAIKKETEKKVQAALKKFKDA